MNEHTTKCWARLSTNCCTPFCRSWLRTYISTNNSIGLGSRLRDTSIHFACTLNGMDPPMCVVTKPWIYRFRLLAPDCERHENRSEVTCSIYAVHISPEMNGGLNSRQTATSFHPSRSLSLACLFDFFLCHTKNHATYFHSNKLEFKT
jgi:hypothetical protein